MAEEPVKYDPAKLMEMVRDRIRATYVSLIPDDQWTAMVKREVDLFFEEKNETTYGTTRSSRFKDVVFSELEKVAKEKVKEELAKLSEGFWTGEVSPQVQKLWVDNMGAIVANVFGRAIQQYAMDISQRV